MSQPASTNLLHLAHLAAVLRPVFRCPTTPQAVHELYCRVVDALDGEADDAGIAPAGGPPPASLDATEAALSAVIMLRNATRSPHRPLAPDARLELDDSDPDIGLHLALYGVERMLARLGWSARPAA